LKTYSLNIGKVLLDMKAGKKSLPDPPCQDCSAACCTQKGSVEINLRSEEREHYRTNDAGNILMQQGRCVYLKADYQCSIYASRPMICRQFNCIWSDLLLPQHQLVAAGKPKMIPDPQESKGEKRERLKHEKALKQIKLQRFDGDVQTAIRVYQQYRLKNG
jgi:Fe-S-cluster containining protein